MLTSTENLLLIQEKEKVKENKARAKREREESRRRKALVKSHPGVWVILINFVHPSRA